MANKFTTLSHGGIAISSGGKCFRTLVSSYKLLVFSLKSDNSYSVNGCNEKATFVAIPSTYKGKAVTSIGDSAFRDCASLASVVIGDSVTSIRDHAFSWCTSLTSAVIPDSVTSIGVSAFYNCTSLTNIVISDSVTSIASSVFNGCSSLTSVVIGDGVTSIGDSAFRDCASLTSVVIPDSVTSIDSGAFYGCTSLTSITVPFVGKTKDGTSSTYFGHIFGSYSFNYSVPSSLKTVVITGGTSIGSEAFQNCSSLTNIVIPNSVTSIGSYAFRRCTSLTSIKYRGTEAQWNAISKGTHWDIDTGNYTITYNYTD